MGVLRLKDYQKTAYEFILTTRRCGLFLDMGLGKTATVLLALRHLLTEDAELGKVLIVGPKRVIENTWPSEFSKWDAFKHMKYSVIAGSAQDRAMAAMEPTPIHLVSRDNLVWLITKGLIKQYDVLVIDELSSFKNWQSQRFKALKPYLREFKRVIGMTGTPVPNGMMDLWAQMFILDLGARLGYTIGQYRGKYFSQGNFGGWPEYRLRRGAHKAIMDKAADIAISMKQSDYLTLPDLIKVEHQVKFSADLMKRYKYFEKEQVLPLQEEDGTITAVNAAVLTGKLLQFCGGAVYNENHDAQPIHTLKLEMLEDLVEQANGSPVLVYYAYQHEKDAILKKFPDALDIKAAGAIGTWNKGNTRLMLAHPASAGHGLNLQEGGSIMVWYNLTYDLELYQQACKRLHRLGQTKPVLVHHITVAGGIDTNILNLVLEKKGKVMDAVFASLRPGGLLDR